MNSTEKQLRCGEIATSALGKIAREIAKAKGTKKSRRAPSEEAAEKSAKNILEEIVLPVLKKCQQDIRAVMDGVADGIDPETGEAIEITVTDEIDGRIV